MWYIKFEDGVWAVWNTDRASSRRIFTDFSEAYRYWMG